MATESAGSGKPLVGMPLTRGFDQHSYRPEAIEGKDQEVLRVRKKQMAQGYPKIRARQTVYTLEKEFVLKESQW